MQTSARSSPGRKYVVKRLSISCRKVAEICNSALIRCILWGGRFVPVPSLPQKLPRTWILSSWLAEHTPNDRLRHTSHRQLTSNPLFLEGHFCTVSLTLTYTNHRLRNARENFQKTSESDSTCPVCQVENLTTRTSRCGEPRLRKG